MAETTQQPEPGRSGGSRLTTPIPHDQVAAFLQVYGEEVRKGAREAAHSIACFPKSLQTQKTVGLVQHRIRHKHFGDASSISTGAKCPAAAPAPAAGEPGDSAL